MIYFIFIIMGSVNCMQAFKAAGSLRRGSTSPSSVKVVIDSDGTMQAKEETGSGE